MRCKSGTSSYKKAYYLKNRERLLEYSKLKRLRRIEQLKKLGKLEEFREKERAYGKKYQALHRVKETRKRWREKNKLKLRAQNLFRFKKWRANNPEKYKLITARDHKKTMQDPVKRKRKLLYTYKYRYGSFGECMYLSNQLKKEADNVIASGSGNKKEAKQ